MRTEPKDLWKTLIQSQNQRFPKVIQHVSPQEGGGRKAEIAFALRNEKRAPKRSFLMVSDDIQLSHQCVLQYLTEIHMGGQSLIV